MRQITTFLLLTLFSFISSAQTTVFSDDFESGTSGWVLTGNWGTSTMQAFNGSNSLADSPLGMYSNNVGGSFAAANATLASNIDLSSVVDATCHFKVKYEIELGFDTCYVDLSVNGGSTWQNISFFNGQTPIASQPWQDVNLSLGGAIGYSAVKVRFRMFTDGGLTLDGIYIDSFRIVTSNVDNSPPFIVHNPLPLYEGQIGTNFRIATITDYSGVAQAELNYIVDGGPTVNTITAMDTLNNAYTFAIPSLSAGSIVKYWIIATDSSAQVNSIQSDTFRYVAGNYVKHDNAVVDFIELFGGTSLNSGIANRMSLPGNTTITTALIRTYTDVNNPQDSIEIHVWANSGGNPGADLIPPITVFPSATVNAPNAMTVLDLRPYSSMLDSLQGSVFIGYLVPSGNTYTTITSGSGNGRGRYWNGSTWSNANAAYTYHFRVVTDEISVAPTAYFTIDGANDPTFNFIDSSSSNTTSWFWDINTQDTSTMQNTSYTFSTAGFKTVCLTASNFVGSNTHCENLTVINSAPVANFFSLSSDDPTISFSDQSAYNPTSWFWDFGDGNFSNDTNPENTYYTIGNYDVCLAVSNTYGDDTACYEVVVSNQLPKAKFTPVITSNNVVQFVNQSSFNPTSYKWYFGTSDSSIIKSPIYQYPLSGGTFEVCLIASNQFGSSLPYCDTLDIPDLVGVEELSNRGISIGPNPSDSYLRLSANQSFLETQVSIIDMQGKLVLKSNQTGKSIIDINTTSIESGMYILKIEEKNKPSLNTPIIIRH